MNRSTDETSAIGRVTKFVMVGVLSLFAATALLVSGAAAASATTGVESASHAAAGQASPEVRKSKWYAEVKCQIVSQSGATHYATGSGTGNSEVNAVKDAKKNVEVPKGSYKRHCYTTYVGKVPQCSPGVEGEKAQLCLTRRAAGE